MPWVDIAMSLGGDASWPAPGNSKSWIRNAVRSITDIMQTYGIGGVDVDYENGLDDTFVPVMSSLMRRVPVVSLAPDNQNLDMYLDLCNA